MEAFFFLDTDQAVNEIKRWEDRLNRIWGWDPSCIIIFVRINRKPKHTQGHMCQIHNEEEN